MHIVGLFLLGRHNMGCCIKGECGWFVPDNQPGMQDLIFLL